MSNHAALRALSDDTVEIELTPEDMLCLSEAAESAQRLRTPAPVLKPRFLTDAAPAPQADSPLSVPLTAEPIGPGFKCNAAAIFVFALFVWWSVDHVFGQPSSAPPATAATIAPHANIAEPAPPSAAANAVVKMRNPFDATEVFEFPAGSSKAEDRQKVADLLLQRARDRRSQWAETSVKPPQNLRAANF